MLLLISNRRSTMLKTMTGNRARCIDRGRTRRDAVRSLVSISGVVVVLQRLENEQAALFGILVALVGRHPYPKRKLQISGEANRNRDSTEMRGHPNRRKVSGWSARVTSQMSGDACSRASLARPASASLRDASPVSSSRMRAGACSSVAGSSVERISAASKFCSASDKNRGGGAAVMPAIHREDPRQNLLRKNNDRRKGAPISVPSNAGEGRVRPVLKTANAGLRSVPLEVRSEQGGFAGCRWRDGWCGFFCWGATRCESSRLR